MDTVSSTLGRTGAGLRRTGAGAAFGGAGLVTTWGAGTGAGFGGGGGGGFEAQPARVASISAMAIDLSAFTRAPSEQLFYDINQYREEENDR
ncbi:MAG TPA: hypothetical protein VFK21_11485 [Gammaproteobacteria bacterium]|nr:hypothetical protein [Gammaproteobacteria bacterium]